MSFLFLATHAAKRISALKIQACFPSHHVAFLSGQVTERHLVKTGLAQKRKLHPFCVRGRTVQKKKEKALLFLADHVSETSKSVILLD